MKLLKRQLGRTPIYLNPIGLGCMGISEFYGETDQAQCVAMLEKAIEIGVNFFDTADFYAAGENEKFIAGVLSKYKDKVHIATKTGIERCYEDNKPVRKINNSRDYIIKSCENSLSRLQLDCIDLFYIHRIDRNTPIEETMQVLADLVTAGKIKSIGLSEVSLETLKRAHKVFPVTAVQSEFSLVSRNYEQDVLPFCESNNINFVSYSPFSRGLLTKKFENSSQISSDDFRSKLPRFQKENLSNNMLLVNELEALCQQKGITLSQLCLAWLLKKSPCMLVIPGTTKVANLISNTAAIDVELTTADMDTIEAIYQKYPVHGGRYPDEMESLVNV